MKKLLLSLWFAYVFLATSSGVCMAEQMYQISETELTESQQDLRQLKINNEQQLILLEQSKLDSLKLQTQLVEARNNSTKLELQIQESLSEAQKAKAASVQAEKLSADLKRDFKQYEKEVNSEIRKVKTERDAGLFVLALKLFGVF